MSTFNHHRAYFNIPNHFLVCARRLLESEKLAIQLAETRFLIGRLARINGSAGPAREVRDVYRGFGPVKGQNNSHDLRFGRARQPGRRPSDQQGQQWYTRTAHR